MRIDIVTLLPEIVGGLLAEGMVRRAVDAGVVEVNVIPMRAFGDGKHHTCDDAPFGGGSGMVLKADVVARAVESLPAAPGRRIAILSASGKPLDQATLEAFAGCPHLVLLCGRYEGMDERVRVALNAEEVSLGPFVLAGGELPAMAIAEGIVRLLPGALGDPGSLAEESFTFGGGLLEYPHYTRPPEFRGHRVPQILLSGDHPKIARWRRWMALRKTREQRPDWFAKFSLGDDDRRLLESREFEEE